MTFTIDEITKECEKCCNKFNLTFNIPVLLNGRLKTTLGRVVFMKSEYECYPSKIEFSKSFLENANKTEIIQTIRHECAHLIAFLLSNELHGHDSYFREICSKIDCYESSAATTIEAYESPQFYKYPVFCKKCGFITGYHRAGKVVKNIDDCLCPTCKQQTLYIKVFN